MIPRPLQVGAGEQRRPMGDRRNGLPHMVTRGAQPADGAPYLRPSGTNATASSITA